jgi:hypothetical protein
MIEPRPRVNLATHPRRRILHQRGHCRSANRAGAGADRDLIAGLNPASRKVLRESRIESALASAALGEPLQFEGGLAVASPTSIGGRRDVDPL